MKYGRRRGDWMRFNCGDRVCLIEDPRHCGTVQSLSRGQANVYWDNGWHGTVRVDELKREDIGADK